jgi:protein phosphatase
LLLKNKDAQVPFNISAFTHIGTLRQQNQDRILVQNHVLQDGIHSWLNATTCTCFVADGIGGNLAGDVAAQFVLEQIQTQMALTQSLSKETLAQILNDINVRLIEMGDAQSETRGMGTTLAGLVIRDDFLEIISAGDSPVWLLRGDLFFQLTTAQVMNPLEENSPLISYFGGLHNELQLLFNEHLREILPDDLFLICSDGLFKALEVKQVKVILSNNQTLPQKAEFLLKKALENGAEDNVSCILIHVQI